jgi:hypothetical protein
LQATELAPLEKLGLNVVRNDPRQRGFLQPCPMWNGICTIYDSPHYPRGCDSYRCKLLRELLDESISLSGALRVVKQAKEKIRVVENLLHASEHNSFRDRLVERLEYVNNSSATDVSEVEFRSKAGELLDCFENQFGANDFLDLPKSE